MSMSTSDTASAEPLPEYVDGLPNLCGSQDRVRAAIQAAPAWPPPTSGVDLDNAESACAIALHMHQPLIPAGGPDLRSAPIISNLRWMMEHQDIGDNHNASVFRWCYRRVAEFIQQLLAEGKQPRVMLDYSGTLLHGLREMGAHDVLDALRAVTTDPATRDTMEWLGTPWGHAVAPSTPIQDYRLHVQAWQHHFAAIFGLEAVGRVCGFSPAEMALPNHPDVGYEFVRTLVDCGFRWLFVQEHTVERPDGGPVEHRHLPHRLVCSNARGDTAEIIAVVKTQGSDTKLVAQMQPYYEARGLSRQRLAGYDVPPLVTQIADGENGGVMMNEFPPKYHEVVRESSGTRTPLVNVTEYLGWLFARGLSPADLPILQPARQHLIWREMDPGGGPDRLREVIERLRAADDRFHVEGGSWTSDISWVRGYESVLAPMERASAAFAERVLSADVPSTDRRYREALFHLLTAETSCYRYWGEGIWTEYGAELARRTSELAARAS